MIKHESLLLDNETSDIIMHPSSEKSAILFVQQKLHHFNGRKTNSGLDMDKLEFQFGVNLTQISSIFDIIAINEPEARYLKLCSH